MNETYKTEDSRDYRKLGSQVPQTKRKELRSEYDRYMDAGRYSLALEKAYQIGDVNLYKNTIKTAEEFYAKYPTLTEKVEFEEMRKKINNDISNIFGRNKK